MSQASLLSASAQLALASYANLTVGPSNTVQQRASLVGAGMTDSQALEFVNTYSNVVTQFNDTATSFSATVFSDVSGNLTLAIRGTQTIFGDIFPTDADIFTAGAGYDQIVAMVNWWARASAPEGQMVQQFRLASYSVNVVPADAVVLRTDGQFAFVLEAAAPTSSVTVAQNISAALAADPDGRVDLTGHSLGGHLAMAFSTLFAPRAGPVTVFNALGFKDSAVNQAFFAKLGGAVPTGGPILNVIADEALVGANPGNFAAGMNSRPGTPIDIAIEKQTNSDERNPFSPAFNHSMETLTDSIAVYKLLTDLCPGLSTADYKVILNQASMFTAASYERIVDTLESLFAINDTPLPVGNLNREYLYSAIVALTNNSGYQARRGALLILPSAGDAATLRANAQDPDAIAHRYALLTLAPFVVLGDDTLYASRNTNGELDLYDTNTRPQGMTESYIADRADFLERKLYITGFNRTKNYEDAIAKALNPNAPPPDARAQAYQAEAKEYLDLASGCIASTGGPADSLQHFIFGTSGADGINGAGREDHLYGGAGNDTLRGFYADDYLEGGLGNDDLDGGVGNDTYVWDKGGGMDLITDAREGGSGPKLGNILFIGQTLAGQKTQQSPDNPHLFTDARGIVYTLIGTPGAGGSLIIVGPNAPGGLQILDFKSGDFGINIGPQTPEQLPQVTGNVSQGTSSFNPSTHTIQDDTSLGRIQVAAAGTNSEIYASGRVIGNDSDNYIVDDGNGNYLYGEGGRDVLIGGVGGDELYGGSGDDALQGHEGDDYLEGGDGSDILGGSVGSDGLVGGDGNDILLG